MRFPRQVSTCIGILLSLSFSDVSAQRWKPEEPEDYYKRWLNEDVVYILSKQERSVFRKLTTDEERENFIEQFWLRRDPDPSTEANEFKEEHYRRIAYANENYKSGADGWTTDRGRIYIMFGPPNEREAFVSGGPYQRPLAEGGGVTTTYPWERWFYRNVPGIEPGLEIEFVDPTLSGKYQIALRKSEKDALFYGSGGATIWEQMGALTRADRLKADIAMRPLGLNNDSLAMNLADTPFEKVEQYFQLQQPAPVRLDDLRTMVDARVSYDQLPFGIQIHHTRINREASLVALTLAVDKSHLTLREKSVDGGSLLHLNLYGRLTTIGQKLAHEFEEDIGLFLEAGIRQQGVYQRKIPLRPGRYKLTLAVQDQGSEKVGTSETSVIVPSSEKEELALSSVVLAREIHPGSEGSTIADGFMTWSGWKIYPAFTHAFRSSDPLSCYLEIYDFSRDQTDGSPHLQVDYEILRGSKVERRSPDSFSSQSTNLLGDRLIVLAPISLEGLEPGRYTLRIGVRDKISGESRESRVEFKITPEKT